MKNNNLLAACRQLRDETTASGSMQTVRTPLCYLQRKCAAAVLAATCLLGVSACSSSYVIHTADGKTFNTQGAPEFTNGGYSFLDSTGQRQQLYLSQVTQVSKF